MMWLRGLEFSFMGKCVSCGVINLWRRLQTNIRSRKSMIDESTVENTIVGYERLEIHVGHLFYEQSDEHPKKTARLSYSIYLRKH